MEKVFSIRRKTHDQKPTDDLTDLDVNTAFRVYFCLSLFEQFILDKIIHKTRGSIKNQLLKSVKQLFRTTEKLIKDQVEITGLSTTDWNQPMWIQSSRLCDRAVRIVKSKTYVFADSVLCLGGIRTALIQAWKDKIKSYLETRYLKDLDRIDREPMELEWKTFPGFTTLGILDEL